MCNDTLFRSCTESGCDDGIFLHIPDIRGDENLKAYAKGLAGLICKTIDKKFPKLGPRAGVGREKD